MVWPCGKEGGQTCGQADAEESNWNEEERTPEEEMGRLHQGSPESRRGKPSGRPGQDAMKETRPHR